MQTTYWWRLAIFSLSGLVFGWGYLVTSKRILDDWYGAYTDPFLFLSLALLIISPSLFFVNDSIFKKWLRFSVVWFSLTIVFIILVPEYQGGWIGFGPEKESVSVLMSTLLVIFSFGQLTWESWKGRKAK